VGITDYAQKSLGDIVYIELPDPGKEFSKGDTFGVVESVKAASDLYSPISGKVTRNNDKLKSTPELVNRDPYSEGWMMELASVKENDLSDLMDAKEYGNFLASIDHE
jgi:glycine cleavage system H protein